MTTYILAGGYDRRYPHFQEALSMLVSSEAVKPRVLSCMFSWPDDALDERYKEYDTWLQATFGTDAQIEYAQKAIFYEQVERADVIYLHGGRTQLLLDSIVDIDRFRLAIDGKIVIGSSAGANFLSKMCFSPSADATLSSTGLLDVGVIVHYGAKLFEGRRLPDDYWLNASLRVRNKLNNSQTPLLLLPEGELAVIRL